VSKTIKKKIRQFEDAVRAHAAATATTPPPDEYIAAEHKYNKARLSLMKAAMAVHRSKESKA